MTLQTALETHTEGAQVLGINQKTAGSELQAGARAELIPSPITKALSSFKGRVAAKTMRFMFAGQLEPLLNYAAFRPYAEMEAVRQALGTVKKDKIVLDPAAGYAPQFFWLAQELPKTQFIELDLMQVIEHKRALLQPFTIPDNLRLKVADLSERLLHDVQKEPVDVVLAIGAYAKHKDYKALLGYLKTILTKDGRVVGTFPFGPGVENLSQNSAIFRRVAGNPEGIVHSEQQLRALFEDSGYAVEAILKFSEMAKQQNKPTPADIEIIAIGRVL